jgi:hypothetical protein
MTRPTPSALTRAASSGAPGRRRPTDEQTQAPVIGPRLGSLCQRCPCDGPQDRAAGAIHHRDDDLRVARNVADDPVDLRSTGRDGHEVPDAKAVHRHERTGAAESVRRRRSARPDRRRRVRAGRRIGRTCRSAGHRRRAQRAARARGLRYPPSNAAPRSAKHVPSRSAGFVPAVDGGGRDRVDGGRAIGEDVGRHGAEFVRACNFQSCAGSPMRSTTSRAVRRGSRIRGARAAGPEGA